jgi:hypothetical protein
MLHHMSDTKPADIRTNIFFADNLTLPEESIRNNQMNETIDLPTNETMSSMKDNYSGKCSDSNDMNNVDVAVVSDKAASQHIRHQKQEKMLSCTTLENHNDAFIFDFSLPLLFSTL